MGIRGRHGSQLAFAAAFVVLPLLAVEVERTLASAWYLVAAHVVVMTLLEALLLPRYARTQDGSSNRLLRDVPRVLAAAASARGFAVAGGVVGALGPLLFGSIMQRSNETAIATGLFVGLFGASAAASYATRIALLEQVGPVLALRKSLAVARRRPIATLATSMLSGACFVIALAGLHFVLLAALAVALRLARDVWTTHLSKSHSAPPSSAGRLRFALGAFMALLLFATLQPGDASAQSLLIKQSAKPVATGPSPVTDGTTPPVVDGATTPLAAQNKRLFDQANASLVDAQSALDQATNDLVRNRGQFIGVPLVERTAASSELFRAKDAELIKAADAASALVKTRQAELATAKQRLLDQANGGSFGTLDRELIDIKNTDSFLLGVGEGTVSGIVDTGKAIGALAQKGMNKLLGRPSQTTEPTVPPLTASEQRLLDNERDLQLDVMRIQDGATANRLIGRTAGSDIIAPIVTAEVGGAVIGRAGAVLGRGAGEESALLGKFGPGEGSVTSSLRGKTKLLSDGRTALGPETTVAGKAVNLTTDNAMAIAPQGPFTVGAHATADSLNFFADAEASQLLSPRTVAIRMWKNGYRGGDVKLISCECGQNAGLVKGLRRELNGLTLDKPVGVIAAPTTVVNGMGELQPGGVWKLFEN